MTDADTSNIAEVERTGFTFRLPDGRLLGHAEYGDPDGYPVVSFHGWPGSRVQGARYHRAALACGIRLIAPERPGFGLSDFQPRRALLNWSSDVCALADHLRIERFSLMGVSGGGPYALACAAALHERIERVAVVSCFAARLSPDIARSYPPAVRMLTRLFLHAPLLMRGFLLTVRWSTERDAARGRSNLPDFIPEPDRQILSQPELIANSARDMQAALRDRGRAAVADARLLTSDWGFDPSTIEAPVDVWQGQHDTTVPPVTGRNLSKIIPHAQLHLLEDQGHYLDIPCSEEILAAILSDRR